MRKFTNENTNPVSIHNLGIRTETFITDSRVEGADFWTGRKCYKCKLPEQRLRMKSNSEKRKFLSKQNPKREEPAKFIIDYIPLCMDEDWEMMAYALSQEKENGAS